MSEDDARGREIADLKARLSALETPPATPTGAPPPPPATKPMGALGCLGIFAGLGVAAFLLLVFIGSKTPSADALAARSSTGTGDANCNVSWAKSAYITARATPLIKGEDVSSSRGFVVIVRRPQWEYLSLQEQKTLAAAIDCAVSGPGGYLKTLRFRTDLDGPDLMKLDATELYQLRKDGFAQGAGG